MKITIKRLRITEEQYKFYRTKFADKISFQRFVSNAIDNEINRINRERIKIPF